MLVPTPSGSSWPCRRDGSRVDLARRSARHRRRRRSWSRLTCHPNELIEAVEQTGPDGVQPHGRLTPPTAAGAAQRAGLLVLRPVRVNGAVDLEAVPVGSDPVARPAADGSLGGSGAGIRLDPDRRPADRDFVLAGGLDPENVVDAVAVSAHSVWTPRAGWSRRPGMKDPVLVRRFVETAKAAGS